MKADLNDISRKIDSSFGFVSLFNDIFNPKVIPPKEQ